MIPVTKTFLPPKEELNHSCPIKETRPLRC